MKTKTKRINLIAESAANAFANHTITTAYSHECFRHFDCKNIKGGSVYRFQITTFPWTMAITGDVGDLMVQHRCHHDIFEWVPSAANDISYFASKVVAGKVKEYDADLVREHLEDVVNDNDDFGYSDEEKKKASKLLNSPWIDLSNQHEAYQEIYDAGIFDCGDFPDCENYDSNYLWCREAVMWFFKNWEGMGAK